MKWLFQVLVAIAAYMERKGGWTRQTILAASKSATRERSVSWLVALTGWRIDACYIV